MIKKIKKVKLAEKGYMKTTSNRYRIKSKLKYLYAELTQLIERFTSIEIFRIRDNRLLETPSKSNIIEYQLDKHEKRNS